MRLTINTNFPEIDRALASLPSEVADKASVSTLNKVVTQANTQMARGITSEFNITTKKVKEKLFIRRASLKGGRLLIEAALFSSGKQGRRALNLINFGARQNKRGVSVKIRKQGGRQVIPGAFIANAGRTVFKRVGQTRLPIKALSTIDVPQMFNTRRINDKVVRFIEQKLPVVFENEAIFYLSRWGGG